MNRLLPISIAVLCLAFAAGSVQAAPPAPGVNILTNGDFSSHFNTWTNTGMTWDVLNGVLRLNNATGSLHAVFLSTGFTAATNDIYDITLQVGNDSAVSKSWSITLDDAGSNSIVCSFTTAAGKPLETYRLRGKVGTTWAALRFLFRVSTLNDSDDALLVDNIQIVYTPSAVVTTTLCDSPTATATPTSTPTFTPTFTPSLTPTSTPALALTWALPTQVIDGTPQPAQYVEFSHEMTAGDAATTLSVLALLMALVSIFVIWILIGRNRRVD